MTGGDPRVLRLAGELILWAEMPMRRGKIGASVADADNAATVFINTKVSRAD